MADWVKIEARTRSTNALNYTVLLDEFEARAVRKSLPYENQEFRTAEGFSRTYPVNKQVEIELEIFFEHPDTPRKIQAIHNRLALGDVFDVTLLSGIQAYSATLEALTYDSADAVLTYGEIVSFDRNWRNIHSDGMEHRVSCKIVIRAGKSASLPTAADYIAAAPLPGGLGN